MITAIDFVSVNVADQERAKRFSTETLGMDLLVDVPMGEPDGATWIEVRPSGSQTRLVLFHAPDAVGPMAPFVLDTDDFVTTCDDLQAKGVESLDHPSIASWGRWWARIRDSEGNQVGLNQRVNEEE